MSGLRCSSRLARQAWGRRSYSSSSSSSSSTPRHLLSIADVSASELSTLVRNASAHKQAIKAGAPLPGSAGSPLAGRTVAMAFSKRSTRTRVSTEAAVARLGGHAMFLGSGDIQLGVNESLHDTAVVVSSMVSSIVARVGPHADVAGLAAHSSVPVINALSDAFHPLQAVADFQTLYETFGGGTSSSSSSSKSDGGLGLSGLKIAWVGDANNVLFDLALAAGKVGAHVSVATPKGFQIPEEVESLLRSEAKAAGQGSQLETTHEPESAVRGADVIVTDTWVSMGQEAEKAERLRQFAGFQVTAELARRGGARDDWKFMHCLPRKPEEVSDEVFFDPQRSLVFPEAENRLYAALSVLEAFVVNKGNITPV